MHIHSTLDICSLKLAGSLRKDLRYFSESCESERLFELAAHAAVETCWYPEAGYNQYRADVKGISTDPGVLFSQKGGRDAPLVIYHHGAAEGSYLFSFKGLFRRRSFTDSGMNLMAVKAPWCRNNKEFFTCISSLSRYAAMLASSAALIEMIIREHRTLSSGPVIVTGMSLGGVVSCLHAALYGSADRYVPILAGPLVGDLFIDSGYAVMTSPEARRTRERHIREVLNFGDEYRAASPAQVYPILGRYDRIFLLEKQLPFFDESSCTIIDKGHSTGASSLAMLSSLLYDQIISEG